MYRREFIGPYTHTHTLTHTYIQLTYRISYGRALERWERTILIYLYMKSLGHWVGIRLMLATNY